MRFDGATLAMSGVGTPAAAAISARATACSGRQEPPKPGPAVRNARPIRVDPQGVRHDLHVGPERVGKPGELVRIRDFGGEEHVGRQLDQRHGACIGHDGRRRDPGIERKRRPGRRLVARLQEPEHHPARLLEVQEPGALTHELGVGDDRRRPSARASECDQPVGRQHRQRRPHDDRVLRAHLVQQRPDSRLDVRHRQRAVGPVGVDTATSEKAASAGTVRSVVKEAALHGRVTPRPGRARRSAARPRAGARCGRHRCRQR